MNNAIIFKLPELDLFITEKCEAGGIGTIWNILILNKMYYLFTSNTQWYQIKLTFAGTISLFVWMGLGVIIRGEIFWDSIIERWIDDVTIRLCGWVAVNWDLAGENPMVFIRFSVLIWTLNTNIIIINIIYNDFKDMT